jgi:methylenetetrahydromethanopterin reductase (EC 1.5.99.11)
MEFGAVLQTNPPASRTIALAKLAEQHGFSHVWTFDSHLLWQEPYVIYSQILAETRKVKVGPFVTNPATRDWTVTASVFATLNEMYGNRTVVGIGRGDSAVRVTNGKPTTLAELREAIHVIRELGNSRSVEYNGAELRFPWSVGSELEVWVAAYGPLALKLAGEVGDGFILQLADVDIATWMIKHVRDAAQAAGRDPDSITFCVAAPFYITDGTEAGLQHAREQCRWFGGMVGNHVADIVAKYGASSDGGRLGAEGPHRLHRGPHRLRLQLARQVRQRSRGLRARRDRRSVLHPGHRRGAHRQARAVEGDRRRPVRRLPAA